MNSMTQLSPKDFAVKMDITPQAVMKKIHNSLLPDDSPEKKNNLLPEGIEAEKFGRVYILKVPDTFVFPVKDKKKKAKAKAKPKAKKAKA